MIIEPGISGLLRVKDIAQVDDSLATHLLFQRRRGQRPKLIPFGDDHHSISSVDTGIGTVLIGNAGGSNGRA